ncbi:M48 metallopeptidase family protein [Natrinema gari]|uniref:M48 metallopeptidase family protein n=1 Tax=Natrinema gari TaxID=419186 RepID=UPI001F4C8FB2|nr:M48 family metallopeptidase [Natrinema gari]
MQDYVIVHELAHAVHDGHSNSFWNTVGTLIPDYEKRREWLRLNSNPPTVQFNVISLIYYRWFKSM